MFQKFQAINRTMLILAGGGLVATMLLQFLFVAPSLSKQLEVRSTLTSNEKAVTDLRQRVAEIQRDGTSSVDALVNRLATIEKVLPTRVDDIALAAALSRIAGSTGVSLTAFDKSIEPVGSMGVLGYQRYNFRVQGSADQVMSFLTQTQGWGENIITIGSFTMGNKNTGSVDAPGDAFTGTNIGSGTLLVWYSTLPALVPIATAPVANGTTAAPVTGTTTAPATGTNP